MDPKHQHHAHHHKDHPHHSENTLMPCHPTWVVGVGFVLTLLATIVWTFVIW